MSAPRVLHCIPTMGGGGAERQLTYLAGALRHFGWSVHVAVMRRGANWARLEGSGAVIHDLALRGPYDWRALGALRRILDEVHPDIVQVWLLQMEVLGGMAALASHTPWVFSERSSAKAYPPTAKNLLRQGMARFATAVVSNSAAGDRYWQARLRPSVRRYVIPNAIPLDEIDAMPPATDDEFGVAGDLPVVLFAGRFGAEKNIHTLMAALDRVLARRAVQVLCCGEGALGCDVDAWAANARAAGRRITVTGYAANLWGIMKRAALLVSPSLFEGSPNVVLEAMACGVPLVVSDIPQHRELLDESSALLVSPHSVEALATAIEAVLQDPAAAAARARVAREKTGRYSLSTVARQYDVVYREILAAGAGR
jgi:glycosyltransferase involved in cell wall biosynthesis